MEPSQKAIRYHDAGCNCAQAVFAAFADRFGIPSPSGFEACRVVWRRHGTPAAKFVAQSPAR